MNKLASLVQKRKKVPQLPVEKKHQQNNKVSSGSGGSLATMWGRVSAKSKPVVAQAETSNTSPNTAVNTAAKVCAGEAVEEGSSDDDDHVINFKRTSNGEGSRKRRVFFEFSDEDDEFRDAVSLASPDPPKSNSSSNLNLCTKDPLVEKGILNINEHEENKPEVKKDNDTKKEPDHLLRKAVAVSKSKRNGMPTSDKAISNNPESNACIKDKGTSAGLNSSRSVSKGNIDSGISSLNQIQNRVEEAADTKNIKAAPSSPKKRKVLKTRIDERGREVTEVVWEGNELEAQAKSNTTVKASNSAVTTDNRPPAPKKSPTVGFVAPLHPVSKAGNKKAGKDPKQGNILSFFKKV